MWFRELELKKIYHIFFTIWPVLKCYGKIYSNVAFESFYCKLCSDFIQKLITL